MKRIFVILLSILSFSIYSQINKNGLPLYTYYSIDQYKASGQNWAAVKDKGGIMYFGNTAGILRYDGVNWLLISNSTNSAVQSLAIDTNNILYAGSENEFGAVYVDSTGKLSYHLLSDQLNDKYTFTNIWKTYVVGNKSYFCSNEYIFIYDKLQFSKAVKLPKYTMFTFYVNNDFYIGSYHTGLMKLVGDSLQAAKNSSYFEHKDIYGIVGYDSQNLVIATGQNGIVLYNITTGQVSNFITVDKLSFLPEQSMIYSLSALYDGNFIVTTINGGAFIFDRNGDIIYYFSKESGLADNIVIFAYQNNGPLWLGLNDGLVKVDYNIPVTEQYVAKNIDGTINYIKLFKNTLYIATDAGVYYVSYQNNLPVLKKMKNINTQVFCLSTVNIENDSFLFAGSNNGIYCISDTNKVLPSETFDSQGIITKQVFNYKNNIFLISKKSVFLTKYENGIWGKAKRINRLSVKNYSIIDSEIWFFTNKSKILKTKLSDSLIVEAEYFISDSVNIAHIENFNDTLLVAGNKGIYYFDKNNNKFNSFGLGNFKNKTVKLIQNLDNKKLLIVTSENNIDKYYTVNTVSKKIDSLSFKLLPETNYSLPVAIDKSSNLYISHLKNVYYLNTHKKPEFIIPGYVFLSKVQAKSKDIFSMFFIDYKNKIYPDIPYFSYLNESKTISLDYVFNDLRFYFFLPNYFNNDKTLYSYRLVGNTDEWSEWSHENFAYINNLLEGEYTLQIKAKTSLGYESKVFSFKFEILSPWYRTIWAYIAYVIIAVLLIILIVYLNNRRLIKEKIQLEKIVKERTAEIVAQKEEIEAQKEEIEAQKDIVVAQKERIELIHQEMTDSIYYARRIQRAILPHEEHITKTVPEHFILFKPKDIVSGDYYWASIVENENHRTSNLIGKLVITAADCTGHGVPGAFMSMLGVSFLNEIVNEKRVTQSNIILNMMRENVITSLQQKGEQGEQKDGMDMALCVIDLENMKAQFSGANNPLYLIRHKSKPKLKVLTPESEVKEFEQDDYILYEFKADKMPIAIHIVMDEFRLNEFELESGDALYVFSDGFADQFGGPKGKKFKYKPFKRLLIQNQHLSMNEQKEVLDKAIEEWKDYINPITNTHYEQIDDIVVIGIKIN